jgi:hypothetical protein
MEGEHFALLPGLGTCGERLLGGRVVGPTAWLMFGRGLNIEGPLVEGNSGRNSLPSGPLLRHFVCDWLEHPGCQKDGQWKKRGYGVPNPRDHVELSGIGKSLPEGTNVG